MAKIETNVTADPITVALASAAVVAAGAGVPAAMAKFEAAKDAVTAAAAALQAAEHRASNARHDDDAEALVQAVEDADLALRRAKVAATVAASQVASARQHHVQTTHDALGDAHAAAVAARRAACVKGDEARAAMAVATAEFEEATRRIQKIYASGRQRQFDGMALSPHSAEPRSEPPLTMAEDALWERVG